MKIFRKQVNQSLLPFNIFIDTLYCALEQNGLLILYIIALMSN